MDEKMLSLEQEIKIKEKALKLKEEKKLRKICPMVVFGDTANGEKEIYVAYMSEPSFPQFSKFMAASKKDEVIAMRTLARDCFVDGDKELVDDESLFLFGLMGQLSELSIGSVIWALIIANVGCLVLRLYLANKVRVGNVDKQ